ncbi:MAG: CusA/CzcA family heavy metal efflux RND transporter [Novosphingobium sp.]
MLAKLIEVSVRFRWTVAVLALVLVAFGLRELTTLPIDAVPDITNRQVVVTSVAPALGPEEVEAQVTFPLEAALAGIPGLLETRSISRHGLSQITAVFTDATDIYFARSQVNERLQSAGDRLPEGVAFDMGPIATGLGEVFIWTVEFSGPLPRGGYPTPEGQRLITEEQRTTYLRTVQDWIIAPQLRTVPGVAAIDVLGGYVKEYTVQPDPARLAGYPIGLSQLVDALGHANRVAGAGYITRGGEAYVVRADARIRNLEELAQTPVARQGGVIVRVSDLATVSEGHAPRLGSASENGREVVIGTAMMLAGENSRTIAGRVRDRLEEINRSLPSGVIAKPVLDRTKLVDATIRTVAHNLAFGALLVVAVLFFMLGNVRAALIAAAVIPLSFLVAAIGMTRAGISGNLMSLGALDFGLIVDGAVVVIENTLTRLGLRRRELGRELTAPERLAGAADAASEMARPAAFGQVIVLLVFAPLLTFEGVEGKMFTPMALTFMFALAGAFVLSFTFVPAMAALFLKPGFSENDHSTSRLARLTRWFEPRLRQAVARPKQVATAALLSVALGLTAFLALGREFIPQLDEHDLLVQAVRIPSTSLEQAQAMQFRVERTLAAMPEVALTFTRTGTAELASDPMPPNVSDTFVMLKPRADWPNPRFAKEDLVARMERELGKLLGNNFEFTQPIQMRFNELIAGVRSDVAVQVYGDDFAVLAQQAERIAAILRDIDGAADVRVEQVSGQPTITATVDRTAAAALGVHASDAAEALSIAFGGRTAGQVLEGDRRFDVVVRLDEQARRDSAVMLQLPVSPEEPEGGLAAPVPLSSIARFDTREGPNQISRENGKRRITVQANVRGRDLGSFVGEAQRRVASNVRLPAGYWLGWGGQFENLERASARLMLIVPVVLLVIGILLFLALGSVAEAALVFAGIPLALVGGALALLLRGMPFSISAAVGFIAVSGVATLNGLVLLQSINSRLAAGSQPADAAVQGALSRLRAVLTTALVATLGFVPMAIASGAGAEVQKPLATVVIGGLTSSTLLTLFVIPALTAWLGQRARQNPHEPLRA